MIVNNQTFLTAVVFFNYYILSYGNLFTPLEVKLGFRELRLSAERLMIPKNHYAFAER